uniref:TMV resistance protein N isoform X3 n=1 Tax=Cicer arietinum TaxID=3827 RepID=A0A1S3E1Y5_CICAR|nr:TMV resistance protein N isoform X3 [Cicer arietinum]
MSKRTFGDIIGEGGSSSSSSKEFDSIQSYRYIYDVFISFRGVDTRNTFVDHLYAHLIRKGIFVFKDDKQLHKGNSISRQLLQAIQHSRISIIVFSKDYASSTWCLDEMAAIAECHRELKQPVFPIFYDVDPSCVRKQIGLYESAFLLLAEQFKHDPHKVDGWKRAMTCLGGSAGWDVRNKLEFEEIEKIVQAVIKTLGHKFSGFADDLIGMQPRVEALKSILRLSSEDDGFRVLGIWGMGGIGKTTLATVLYDTISHYYQFGACCFIENVSTIYRDGGATAVQKQILRQTLKEKNLDAYSSSEISGIIINRLYNRKLLVVLDDVDQFEQLQELHINPKLLRPGSRIIITTRDMHILELYGVDRIYEAELMNDNDAHDLLCRKAFKSDNSRSPFVELIPKVLKYTQGLPLAIRIMGSFLFNRNAMQWRATFDGLQNNPDKRIMKVLQMSFEGLQLREREIFLHVACFFEGEREDYVRRILHACGLQPNIGIPLIAEKSLITIRNQVICMHKMLLELGKQIVQGQHLDEPRFWNRLWLYRDFHHVMMTKVEATETKAIVLDQKEDGFKFSKLRVEDLSKMEHLKLLILNHKNFSGKPIFLSNSLYYFSWNGYPFTALPSNFQPYDLVELNMPDSNIEQLWEGIQCLPCLKRMDLSNSKNLKMTPCFDGILNLERLDLTGCINLLQVHPSIGLLSELVFLSLQKCSSLVHLDFGSASRLWSLRVLLLSGCTKLKSTPDFTGAINLEYLDVDHCASLFTFDGSLAKLRVLSLRDCTNLVRLGDSLDKMTSLTTLDLCGCLKYKCLPVNSAMKSLVFLDLSFCNISNLPQAIGELRGLERLNLQGNNFTAIPSLQCLSNLAYLNLSYCHCLQRLPQLPTTSGPSDSMGIYFKTTSGSRDHRSGLYVFDCRKIFGGSIWISSIDHQYEWLQRLLKEPRHFRCGFDIVLPFPCYGSAEIPMWFDHRYKGGSIIRIKNFDVNVDWVGFVFFVQFEVRYPMPNSASSQHPYPFYLSFESEHTEERFDMPLSLKSNKVDGSPSEYCWTIYISQEHCHFVKTEAQITFKAYQGLIMKEWGFHMLTEKERKYVDQSNMKKVWLLKKGDKKVTFTTIKV